MAIRYIYPFRPVSDFNYDPLKEFSVTDAFGLLALTSPAPDMYVDAILQYGGGAAALAPNPNEPAHNGSGAATAAVAASGNQIIDGQLIDIRLAGGVGEQGSAGLTNLLAQFSTGGNFFFSGARNIDAVLFGSQWSNGIYQNLWYNFNSTAAQYGAGYDIDAQVAGTQAITGFSQFNAAQQAGARYTFALIAGYTNANFTEVAAGAYADFRFGNSTYPGSAFANFPSSLPQAGDMWFNLSQPFYSTPGIGNWGLATIMHELGHSLGLKHGHDNYTSFNLASYLGVAGPRYGTQAIETAFDGQAYSLMTYRGGIGQPISFQGDGFNQPQTYMALDIAALQYMYGADFSSAQANAGNSVYQFNTTTGQMSINSVGQGLPSGNIVFRTVWDGGGNDTYNLANYSTPMYLDLNPGGWLVFDVDASGGVFQRANNQPLSGPTTFAPGNVANAYLYQGNTASLIENAVGGTGSDTIIGNSASNILRGGLGNDTINGGDGIDSAVFAGLRSAYMLTALAGTGVRVVGPDGTDTLTNVELLVFDDQTVTWPLSTPSTPSNDFALIGDFNGDGKGDLLWRNQSGEVVSWQTGGKSFGVISTSWSINGTGDFDGNGRSDLLWRNLSGEVQIWQTDGPTRSFGIVSNNWQIQTTGDFDGDGQGDILWRKNDGDVQIWEMAGGQQKSSTSLGVISNAWHIASTGDFNGDRQTDILWRNDSGETQAWIINNGLQHSTINYGIVSVAWKIQATGDFDGDGRSDILWRNDSGEVVSWQATGASTGFGIIPNSWHIEGTADFNGDRQSDILWRKDDGNVQIWEIAGGQWQGGIDLGIIPTSWSIVHNNHDLV